SGRNQWNPVLPVAGDRGATAPAVARRKNSRMGGFPADTGVEYSAYAALCHVVRNGVLLPVGRVERRRGEADRHQAGRSQPEWPAPDVLHDPGPGREVLRKHSTGRGDRVEGAGDQKSSPTRRNERRTRAGPESQEQHEWRTRAQTGEELQPR